MSEQRYQRLISVAVRGWVGLGRQGEGEVGHRSGQVRHLMHTLGHDGEARTVRRARIACCARARIEWQEPETTGKRMRTQRVSVCSPGKGTSNFMSLVCDTFRRRGVYV